MGAFRVYVQSSSENICMPYLLRSERALLLIHNTRASWWFGLQGVVDKQAAVSDPQKCTQNCPSTCLGEGPPQAQIATHHLLCRSFPGNTLLTHYQPLSWWFYHPSPCTNNKIKGVFFRSPRRSVHVHPVGPKRVKARLVASGVTGGCNILRGDQKLI